MQQLRQIPISSIPISQDKNKMTSQSSSQYYSKMIDRSIFEILSSSALITKSLHFGNSKLIITMITLKWTKTKHNN